MVTITASDISFLQQHGLLQCQRLIYVLLAVYSISEFGKICPKRKTIAMNWKMVVTVVATIF